MVRPSMSLSFRRRALVVLVWLSLALGRAAAQSPIDLAKIDPQSFHAIAVRLPKGQAPKIDGRLDDAVWNLAPVQGNFIQREPTPGAPISERTEFKILYDDRKIYFALWAFDSNAKAIRASEWKRDSGLAKGDQMRIVIDTFHDRRNGFYFATNPLGALKDAQYTDNARVTNNDWNAVWDCRTTIDDKGWYAEIAIPLSQLRFKTAIGDTTWGLNVGRRIVRKNEESYWGGVPSGTGRLRLRALVERRRPRRPERPDIEATARTRALPRTDSGPGLFNRHIDDETWPLRSRRTRRTHRYA